MTNRINFFLIVLFLSLPFWWGTNLLEKDLKDFFFWQELDKKPELFTAQIISPNLMPLRIKALKEDSFFSTSTEVSVIEEPNIAAKSAASVFISDKGKQKVLFEKNSGEKLPIASLTKLMTALIVLENYDLSKEIKISKEAVNQEETFGQLEEGKIFKTSYLLYPLLMESSNDAAFALANDYEGTGEEFHSSSSIATARIGEEFYSSSSIATTRIDEKKFVEMMNNKAQELGLLNTHFYNSSGLEPDTKDAEINYSTAKDLVELIQRLLKEPKIWEILSTAEYNLYGPTLKNTNELLLDQSLAWHDRILGGKTGYAEKAGGCIILVILAPKDRGFLINIVLGTANSDTRFEEMKKLVAWVNQAYKW
ncbi:MAG: hypothetical protein Q7S82_04070 [bacterium]|nr:hypothetical protein [bacterium]